MQNPLKLFLYSMNISAKQAAELTQLVGKKPEDITFALIENAADVEPDLQNWLGGFRDALSKNGYQLELIDLRNWQNDRKGLREKLASKDVIWLGGGNTYYLRWILKETGADEMIVTLIKQGKVYAGWSAGAMVAGPTLECIEAMETRQAAPELILDGLHLIDLMVIPHIDNEDFIESALLTNHLLRQEGFKTVLLRDDQALLIQGAEQKVI